MRNVTWLADADYAYTSGRAVDGRLSFAEALAWAAGLELYGVRGWRLPVGRPHDVAGCIAGSVTVGCGSITGPQPSELWDLMHDALAPRSLYLQGSHPTLLDYRAAASGNERVQVPGLDPGVRFDNVMQFYWVAALRSEIAECSPGAECDPTTPVPAPVPTGGYRSPDGQTFYRCLIPAQCAGTSDGDPTVRAYPEPPLGTFHTGTEAVWPWQMEMLTDFQQFRGGTSAPAHVWLVRTGDIAPVPEPASWVSLLVELGLLCARARRRTQDRRTEG